MITVD